MLQTLEKPQMFNPFCRHKQALLVQQNAGLNDNALFIDDILQSRGYEVSTITPRKCTKEYVALAIDELANGSGPDSRTLFYYGGHGFQNVGGLVTVVDAYPKGIEPYELFTRLGKIRGKKAVIVDSCLSGEFTDYLKDQHGEPLIANYVAIASCPRDRLTISAPWSVTSKSRLKGRTISNVVYWMWRNHCEYGTFYLDKWPLEDFSIPLEEAEKLAQMFPHIAVGQLSLDMQRISDTGFDL